MTRHWIYFKEVTRTKRESKNRINNIDMGDNTVPFKAKNSNGRDQGFVLDQNLFGLFHCPTVLSTEYLYALRDKKYPKSSVTCRKCYEEVINFVKERLVCDPVVPFHQQV